MVHGYPRAHQGLLATWGVYLRWVGWGLWYLKLVPRIVGYPGGIFYPVGRAIWEGVWGLCLGDLATWWGGLPWRGRLEGVVYSGSCQVPRGFIQVVSGIQRGRLPGDVGYSGGYLW